MFTLGELVIVAVSVFVIGIVVSICIAFLYLMMRMIDKRINSGTALEPEKAKTIEKVKYSAKEKAGLTKDDVPFSAPPVKVETSFEDRRIGKV